MKNYSQLSTYLKDTLDLEARKNRARGLSDCVECSW
jgi:hypothetical protein